MPLVSFSSGQVISSSNVNANFGLCVLTDTSRTVTVTHTYTATQTLTGGFTTGTAATLGGDLLFTDALYDIGKTGATRPRDLFISRNAVIGGSLTLSTAISKLIPGATSFSLRNNADGADNLLITDAGIVTMRSDLVTSLIRRATSDGSDNSVLELAGGGGTLQTRGAYLGLYGNEHAGTGRIDLIAGDVVGGEIVFYTGTSNEKFRIDRAGSLKMSVAAGKIIPGATSVTFRNNADTQNNLQIVDAGDVTIGRGNLTLSLGNFIITGVAGTVQIGGNQVVGPRLVGYTNAWTGAAANLATGYDASTITLPQLAARVRALQESITTHGLIGV